MHRPTILDSNFFLRDGDPRFEKIAALVAPK
jgi:hypothetical protein